MMDGSSHVTSLTVFYAITFLIKSSSQQGFASAPQNLTATTDAGKPGEQTDKLNAYIKLTWSRPLVINGSITGYEILYGRSDGTGKNDTIGVGGSITTATIHKLITYRNFTIFIRAKTDLGYGVWSDPFVVLSAEGVPTEGCQYVQAFSPSPTTIYLEWSPLPLDVRHGVILGYKVLYLKRGDVIVNYIEKNVPLGILNYTITGLKPYSTYYAGTIGYTKKGFYIYQNIINDAKLITTMEDVPSRSPEALSVTMLCQQYSLSIQWSPLPTQYRNGKLLGYNVLLTQDTRLYKNFTSTIEKTLISVDECKNYSAQVAAFTSPGVGKYSRVDVASSCPCGPPNHLYSNRNVVAKENNTLNFTCEHYGRPQASLYWLRHGQVLNKTGNTGLIYIASAHSSDGGTYTCVLNNTFGSAMTDYFVVVAKGVVSVELKLNVIGLPSQVDKRQSQWFKENIISKIENVVSKYFKELNDTYEIETTRISLVSDEVLNIHMRIKQAIADISMASSSTKRIKTIVTNTMGQGTSLSNSIKIESISFQEAPPSPFQVKVTEKQSNSIRITWKNPEHQQFYNISGYSVRYKKDSKLWMNDSQFIGPDVNYAKVENLQSNTKYELLVVAHNEYGEGKSRSISVSTTANLALTIALAVIIPLLLLIILGGFIFWWRRQRQKRQEMEQQLFKEQEERIRLEKESKNLISFEDLLEMQNKTFEICWKEIPRDNVEMIGILGSGAFGEVKKAKLTLQDGGIILCAVKMLKSQATKEELSDLANELNIMATIGEHPNIVSLIGACSVAGPLWVIVKLADNGSLLEYLQSIRSVSASYENIDSKASGLPTHLSEEKKLALAHGIASGMKHLADHKCVHRDLAARNVLLGKDNQPMVSDFGLSRDIYESGQYEKTTSGKLPVKWMAIESLENMIFTLDSDVWSYGVVLWEIESLGEIPFPGLNGREILNRLKQGLRLEKPSNCTTSMYKIMSDCWDAEPKQRPKFELLLQEIELLMASDSHLNKEGNEEDPTMEETNF